MAMLYLRNKPIGAISSGASGGGHTIENTSGTDMEQRSDLQFVGVYTEDDSANDRTKVNVVRTMTKAQMDALSAAEKVGFIRTSDEADNPYQSAYLTTAVVSCEPTSGNNYYGDLVTPSGYTPVGILMIVAKNFTQSTGIVDYRIESNKVRIRVVDSGYQGSFDATVLFVRTN